jgi:hypothetical protein
MRAIQTQCDQCGKTHEVPLAEEYKTPRLVELSLPWQNAPAQKLDFCDEKCCREFLIARRTSALEASSQLLSSDRESELQSAVISK